MTEKIPSYDDARNLATHVVNLEHRIAKFGKPEGDCALCADVCCLFNVTKVSVLRSVEKDPMGDNVKQFTCNDTEADPSLDGKVLRYIW